MYGYEVTELGLAQLLPSRSQAVLSLSTSPSDYGQSPGPL